MKEIEDRALQVSKYDALNTAKEITGSEELDDKTGFIGLMLLHGKDKLARTLYQELDDTYYDISWSEANRIFQSNGFEVIESYTPFDMYNRD